MEAITPTDALHRALRWCLGLGTLALYTFTCCRTVHWADSGELIFAGAVLGIAHPPGHPLYSMLAHLFSWLPIGPVAFRINWMSAVFGAVAVVLSYEVAAETLRRLGTPPRRATGVAAFAALVFGLTVGLWGGSTVAETTTLHAALLAGLFWLVWRIAWVQPTGPALTQALGAAAALYGFGATNHVAGILFLPALAVLLVSRCGREVLAPKNLVVMFACVGLGLSLYAFLYLRSHQNPALDWGNPETLSNLWWVVSAKQFQGGMARSAAGAGAWQALANRGAVLVGEWTPVGAGLVVVGLLGLARRAPWLALFTLLCLVPLVVLGLKSAFILAYFVPGLLLMTVALAVGCDVLLRRMPRVPVWATCAAALCLPAWSARAHYGDAALQDDYSAEVYGRTVLEHLDPNSAFITTSGDQAFIFWALQSAAGHRTDVAVINPTWGATDTPTRESLEEQYPDMRFLRSDDLAPYEARWGLPRSSVDLRIAALLDANAGRRPLFMSMPVNDTVLYEHLELRGAVLRYREQRGQYLTDAAIEQARTYWDGWFVLLADRPALGTDYLVEALGNDLNNQGKFFEGAGREDLALWNFDTAIHMNPRMVVARLNRGRLYGRHGDWPRALRDFEAAVGLDPRHPAAQYFRGVALESTGQLEDAYRAYLETLLWEPADGDALRQVGLLLLRTAETDRAAEYLRRALAANPEDRAAAQGLLQVLLAVPGAMDTQVAVSDDRAAPTPAAAAERVTRQALAGADYPRAAAGLQCLQALRPPDVHLLLLLAEYAARTEQRDAGSILAQAFARDAAATQTVVATQDWASALARTEPLR